MDHSVLIVKKEKEENRCTSQREKWSKYWKRERGKNNIMYQTIIICLNRREEIRDRKRKWEMRKRNKQCLFWKLILEIYF